MKSISQILISLNTTTCCGHSKKEFTYAVGGCTIVRGLEGSYLSRLGRRIPDQVNLIYSDVALALSTDFALVAGYAGQLKRAAARRCPRVSKGMRRGHCIALPKNVRICKLLADEKDTFLVQRDGKSQVAFTQRTIYLLSLKHG